MSEIDRAMLQSMASSFRGAMEFSFNRHDMAELMDRCATRTDLSQATVAAALEAAAGKARAQADGWKEAWETAKTNKNPKEARDWQSMMLAGLFVEDSIRALITPAQHDALAAHVAAEVAKARAEWVGSHCKELTAADRAHIIAHLSYELEPVGKPPTWNQLAMEVVRLSNALAQIGSKP